jgi:cell division protein FtsW (lipid II flippase)
MSETQKTKGRNLERGFLLLITIILALLFVQLYKVQTREFEEVPGRLADGTMVNLNADKVDERIQTLLERGYYLEDKRDIALIRATVAHGMTTGDGVIDNIGELNKRKYNVNAEQAYAQGGESYRKRVKLSRTLLGFAGADSLRFQQEVSAPPQLPASTPIGMGRCNISGEVLGPNDVAISGVLVRLEMLLPRDSIYDSEVTEVDRMATEATSTLKKLYALDSAGHRQLQSLAAYARTDAQGKYSFTGLPEGKAFTVLPLQPGYQFGPAKGIGQLDENTFFIFHRSPHSIRLLSTKDFNNLKKERSLIVRTPEEYKSWYWIIVGGFFAAFLLLHILLSLRFPSTDQLIVPVVMLLVGFSFITLLSLQDPLRDRFLARSTLGYFTVGFLGLCVLMLFDLRRFTTDSGLYRMFFFGNDHKAANGSLWAALAIALLLVTIVFGTGPEGSGVKVNLFGFQPSEIVKFIMLLFLAGFYTANERFISEYTRWQKRWTFFSYALIAIVTSILLFLILGDLGPAMVVCFTFIILFSFSRGDFAQAVGAVVLYVLSIWLLKNIWIATGIAAAAVVLSAIFMRRGLSESAVMTLVVMAGFLLLDQIPFLDNLFPGPVQRLVDRKAIFLDPWNNEVFGGDHIANSIWAMSSGGITGQGVGEGFAKTIPEAHTDMILPSFGEEFGWAGIICVFILFLVYLHRAIIIGRHTGTPFLFYLCAGIGISTFIQFLLIAGGSTGALPLSGVALPFMSYGGTSLIMNLLAAGFLLSASGVQGSPVQMRFIAKQQDHNLIPALVAAFVGVVLLGVNVSRYLFNNKEWVVQPSLVADRSGARMFSYNPRIAILMNRLQAGTLYDRQGRILGTSKPEQVKAQRDSLIQSGLAPQALDALLYKRLDRYYPYGEHMFFWTGDANTGVFTGGTNGYFAEYEHAAELRGFPTPEVNYDVAATRYREERFLPPTATEMTVVKRDYAALAPLLLAGINSKEVEDFKKRNRDIRLSMDASLQTSIQNSIALDDSLRTRRVSVVVMEDSTGDVLASAIYPLPTVNDWDLLTLPFAEQSRLPVWVSNSDLGFTYATQPGSTAKILTALSAFNKMGPSAARRTFLVRAGDVIRARSEEPDETGTISMERAVVKSNNVYFIRLANEERLQEEMGTLYMQTGMFLRGVGGYYYGRESITPDRESRWRELWRKTEFQSLRSYDPNNIRATRGRGVSGMAWGQGELIATPASVARLSAGVANGGVLVPNRYVLQVSDSVMGVSKGIDLARQPQYTETLTNYMKQQSANKVDRLGIKVAGKTGTPERIVKGRRINDGWYTFFAPRATGSGHIVVCVRIEDCKGSSVAIKAAGQHVIPKLLERGYIRDFDAPKAQN